MKIYIHSIPNIPSKSFNTIDLSTFLIVTSFGYLILLILNIYLGNSNLLKQVWAIGYEF